MGNLHVVDQRVFGGKVSVHAIHGRSKITCVDVNPFQPNLLVTTANDYKMRIWDARNLSGHVMEMSHPKIVTSAFFSPVRSGALLAFMVGSLFRCCFPSRVLQVTGSKIVSTCTDSACCCCCVLLAH